MASVVTVNNIINLLDEMAPPELAESWDNVGLMLGRRNKPVRRLLLALDMTQETVTQALAKKADMLITHHPAIFHKLLLQCQFPLMPPLFRRTDNILPQAVF